MKSKTKKTEFHSKMSDVEERLKSIETMLENLTSSLKARHDAFESKLEQVIKSQDFISKQYDKFRIITDNLIKENTQLKAENKQLKDMYCHLEKVTDQALSNINDLEQYGRRAMLEIAGIPKSKEENPEILSVTLFKSLGINVQETDIEACHRISQRENANIIVKFHSRKIRDQVLRERRQLRGKTTHDFGLNVERAPAKIFINESLTRRNKELFRLAQNFKNENGFRFLWTRNGSIFIRKSEQSKVIKVLNPNNLINIEEQSNVANSNSLDTDE